MKTEDFKRFDINRRQFLQSSAKNAAGVAAGMVGVGIAGAAAIAKMSPGERVSAAVIGLRNQGRGLATGLAALPEAEIAAICDVDESLLPAVAKQVQDLQGRMPRRETDFRRVLDDPSIDAVVIATPDHWHALMTILACQAGKDVYVEKPASHNILEGARMVAAARKHDRVVQVGLQQRSGSHFQSAVELVQSGRIGRVHLAKAWTVHRRKSIGREKCAAVPAGVDYDLWLGPAPERTFTANRFHYNWRWFWDYGSGELGNWGVHMLDVARWGLGVEMPDRVSASGGKFYFNDDQETPDTLLVNYGFGDKTITWEHRLWTAHSPEGRNAAAAFYGDQGTLVVDRGGWKVYDMKQPITSDTSEQPQNHLANFLNSVKTRSGLACDIETGHKSTVMCHLGNIATRLGRELTFDANRMMFNGDTQADLLVSRESRTPWELPAV